MIPALRIMLIGARHLADGTEQQIALGHHDQVADLHLVLEVLDHRGGIVAFAGIEALGLQLACDEVANQCFVFDDQD